jgi:hypothetical protein
MDFASLLSGLFDDFRPSPGEIRGMGNHGTIGISVRLIIKETRLPSCHGILWKKCNPG